MENAQPEEAQQPVEEDRPLEPEEAQPEAGLEPVELHPRCRQHGGVNGLWAWLGAWSLACGLNGGSCG